MLDIAAGTGLATVRLEELGAHVVAADLGIGMLRRLRLRLPEVSAVVTRAESLPFADGVFDVVTSATAWHWVDPVGGASEVLRVLRPGGTFGLWWAVARVDDSVAWERVQNDAFERWGLRRGPAATVAEDMAAGYGDSLRAAGFRDITTAAQEWQREVDLDTHLRHLSTHSPVIALGERAADFLDDLRGALADHPRLTERFVGPLVVGRAP